MDYDVFISYSAKDKLIADALCHKLEEENLKCWIAPRDIRPGGIWASEIAAAIPKSKTMLLIFSSNSNSSEQVLREVELAIKSKLIIVPLKIEDVLPTGGMSYYLSATHWIDAVGKTFNTKTADIGNTIKNILEIDTPNENKIQSTPKEKKKKISPLLVIFISIAVILCGVVIFLLINNLGKGDDSTVEGTSPPSQTTSWQTLEPGHNPYIPITNTTTSAEPSIVPTTTPIPTLEETPTPVTESTQTPVPTSAPEPTSTATPISLKAEVGMITSFTSTIDDKSFTQGTWDGLIDACTNFGYEAIYQKPTGTTTSDYLTAISNLVDSGRKLIVCPGFEFETPIFIAQDQYPDVKFVLIDGTPHSADYLEFRQENNVVSIFFAEEQSGFLAGIAAAVEKPNSEFGFIGGMEIPSVQKFNWGFQQGLNYANANLGTSTTINAENVVYLGSFDDIESGAFLASEMYDKGVDIIFAAAGSVGLGVIDEAKKRVSGGEDVWVVGVDIDQYYDGIYEGSNSVVLTSAMKSAGVAAYDMVKAFYEGKFPGGWNILFDAASNGVQIPENNPNLSALAIDAYKDALEGLIDGSIIVSTVQGSLIK